MKTKFTLLLLTGIIAVSCCLKLFSVGVKPKNVLKKTYLTVSDAKAKAFESKEPGQVVNLKGIYTLQHHLAYGNGMLLEDEEPGEMEEIPLYCFFSAESNSYLKDLEPGTELMLSGMLNRRGNSVEVTDCKILCINKGTLINDFGVWQ